MKVLRLVLDYTLDKADTIWLTGLHDCLVEEEEGGRPRSRDRRPSRSREGGESKMRLLAMKQEREGGGGGGRGEGREDGSSTAMIGHSASMPSLPTAGGAGAGGQQGGDRCWGEFCAETAVEGVCRSLLKLSGTERPYGLDSIRTLRRWGGGRVRARVCVCVCVWSVCDWTLPHLCVCVFLSPFLSPSLFSLVPSHTYIHTYIYTYIHTPLSTSLSVPLCLSLSLPLSPSVPSIGPSLVCY